jgi:hypothetical protein
MKIKFTPPLEKCSIIYCHIFSVFHLLKTASTYILKIIFSQTFKFYGPKESQFLHLNVSRQLIHLNYIIRWYFKRRKNTPSRNHYYQAKNKQKQILNSCRLSFIVKCFLNIKI